MTWRKYFTPVSVDKDLSPLSTGGSGSRPGPSRINYSSYLPDVYSGSPNRLDRYQQYEIMDADPEVNAALDILAEFCTQKLKHSKSPFAVKWRHKATNSEIRILSEYLQQWNRLQQFDTRIFRIVRNTFKYGDCFFIRDPETQKWHWIDPSKVVKIIVNESDGKRPEQYVIKDLAPNFEDLVVTQITPNVNPRQTGGGVTSSPGYFGTPSMQRGTAGPYPSSGSGSRFGLAETEYAINAEHVVHLSLSEGLDNNYPFGNSLLENIYKVYKQKELLEDAILIYRIQRAPERRVFHIDVGNMPTHMAMAFVERVKTEIHQRRIPSQSGGNANIIDSAYNPLCLDLATRIPLLDGRTLMLSEIIEEFDQDRELWTYSCDPATGRVVPGIIDWAGITRQNTEVVELTLSNQRTLVCTPDHKVPTLNRGFVAAADLQLDDDLIAFVVNDAKVWDRWSSSWIDSNFGHQQRELGRTYSCRIVDVQHVASRDVGTLTIDRHEVNHGYHTFAVDAGIFVKNSINEDYYFPKTEAGRGSDVTTLPGGCFAMDTQVRLMDGRDLSISEIAQEMSTGMSLWTYSCEPITGKIVAGLISWAGVTKQSAQVLKLTLSNDQYVVCTPEHKFCVYSQESKRADELVVGEQLITRDLSASICVQSIEYLHDEIEVGTLTIDQYHDYHDYHTFALTAGVMVFNSNLGEIDDLRYFTNKLFRGLRIPSSYLPTGAEDSQSAFNDGRVGTAYIQELRFNKYCERLQTLITEVFDVEFKMYMYTRGLNIDSNLFELEFNPPMNFASTRQSTMDAERINTFTTIQSIPFMSNRFALKRFLGLTDEEMAENERLWAEENGHGQPTYTDAAGELRSAGLSAAGIEGDLGMAGDLSAPEDLAAQGDLGSEPDMGAMQPPSPATGALPM